jgi:hypothetical protein
MKRTIEESLILYEQIKKHFDFNENAALVIEISDLPMSEWKTAVAYTRESKVKDRSNAAKKPGGFAAFSCFNSEKRFSYFDYNVRKAEDLKSGQLEYFENVEYDNYEKELAATELEDFLQPS